MPRLREDHLVRIRDAHLASGDLDVRHTVTIRGAPDRPHEARSAARLPARQAQPPARAPEPAGPSCPGPRRRAGLVLSREVLLERVWGYDFDVTSNAVDTFVGYLRRKLEAAGEPRMLRTVRGVGFVLREPGP
ncbi:winged helix-turn-helix domain-containing protein [Nonomuraea pusilla]|uniref:winged helix-turn-helix domain-containing protein n=1 Tax=Nonomuraea pusilla TaxID=46177 RepID=UPI00332EC55C